MNYQYTFSKGKEFITVVGTGDDPHNLDDIQWISSRGAKGVLDRLNKLFTGYTPTKGFVTFEDFPNDIYVQISKFQNIFKDGWRFKDSNLPVPVKVEKSKTKKRVYVKAGKGHKAYYREQEVGRKEIEPVKNLWEIKLSDFMALVEGTKDALKEEYIRINKYDQYDSHPRLEHLLSLMDEDMREVHIPILSDFTEGKRSLHKNAVLKALREGKDVSPHVLKDYPKLAEQYEKDISHEAIESAPFPKDNKLYNITKDNYDKIIKSVKVDYDKNLDHISDSDLKLEFGDKLDDIKRSARMRKVIYNNMPEHIRADYTPNTIDFNAHREMIIYATITKESIPLQVKAEYPMLFRDVPVKYEPTDDLYINEAVNSILTDMKEVMLDKTIEGSTTLEGAVALEEFIIKTIGAEKHSEINFEPVSASIKDIISIKTCITKISKYIGENVKEMAKTHGDKTQVIVDSSEDRPYHIENVITLGKNSIVPEMNYVREDDLIHEYGHALEYLVPEISKVSQSFLEKRTENEYKLPLNEIYPGIGYGDGELAKPDHFLDAYMGKIYDYKSTEILSMGLGALVSRSGLMSLYEQDPEYLGFIIGVASGKIFSKIAKFETDDESLEKIEFGFINNIISGITSNTLFKRIYKKIFRAFDRNYTFTQSQYNFKRTTPDEEAIENLKTRELILSDKTTSQLTGNLRFELLEGLKNHESIDEIKRRLDKIFNGANTERIARTEILHSMNAGKYHAYEKSGVVKYAVWKAHKDKREGEDSKRLDGQIQPLGTPFVDYKTGKLFMHPPNRPQCRCTTVPYMELPEHVMKHGLKYLKE